MLYQQKSCHEWNVGNRPWLPPKTRKYALWTRGGSGKAMPVDLCANRRAPRTLSKARASLDHDLVAAESHHWRTA